MACPDAAPDGGVAWTGAALGTIVYEFIPSRERRAGEFGLHNEARAKISKLLESELASISPTQN